MRTVTIYSSELCAQCHSVESLLDAREIPYETIAVEEGTEAHERLVQRSGMTSLPQVFVGNVLIGGYRETLAADQAGMLADLVVD